MNIITIILIIITITIILIIAHPPHWIALHIRTLDTAHHDLLPNLASATAEQYQQALTSKHYFGFQISNFQQALKV